MGCREPLAPCRKSSGALQPCPGTLRWDDQAAESKQVANRQAPRGGPNLRLTAASFAPLLPTEGGAAAFIGDYIGLAAGPAGVFPFYQDSRRGEQDVWVQRLASPLSRDGFESEDTSAWSATVS